MNNIEVSFKSILMTNHLQRLQIFPHHLNRAFINGNVLGVKVDLGVSFSNLESQLNDPACGKIIFFNEGSQAEVVMGGYNVARKSNFPDIEFLLGQDSKVSYV